MGPEQRADLYVSFFVASIPVVPAETAEVCMPKSQVPRMQPSREARLRSK